MGKTYTYTGAGCVGVIFFILLFIVGWLFFLGGLITLAWNIVIVAIFPKAVVLSWLQGAGIALLLWIVATFFKRK